MTELEKLLAEATPGPWGYDTLVFVDGQALLTHTDRLGVLTIPDAALIVAAINALPELLERVKRYESALEKIANPATYSHSLPSCCQHTFDDTCELFSDIARAALNQEAKL